MNPAEKIQAAIDKLSELAGDTDADPWNIYALDWRLIVSGDPHDDDPEILFDIARGGAHKDGELVVTLHRTIEAQLAILRAAKHAHKVRELGNMSYSRPDGTWRTELEVAALDLAETILGDSDA